jgi:ferrous iron transport protein B
MLRARQRRGGNDDPATLVGATGSAPNSPLVAVIGNPNSGKTSLFNALTGLHQKVGNYPGVTVEKREGLVRHGEGSLRLLDLPGTYSLQPVSDDERVVRDVMFGLLPQQQAPSAVLLVIDATQLNRQLMLVLQVMELGLPAVVALTMMDEAQASGTKVDAEQLAAELGVPVVAVHAPSGKNIARLKLELAESLERTRSVAAERGSSALEAALGQLAVHLAKCNAIAPRLQRQLALQLLLDQAGEHPLASLDGAGELARQLRSELEAAGVAWQKIDTQRRFAAADRITELVINRRKGYRPSISDRADRWLTHPIGGLIVFALVMALVFQAVFTWSAPMMGWIEDAVGWLGRLAANWLPEGPLRGLVVDGVIGGVGSVLVFLPQILLLFLFIALLEDSGYMSRAAMLMNKHMRRAGLSGRSFIPMMCGFACAIPAVMATRTIPDKRDRLITMLVVPLISCSARLPVYTLMIAACVPAIPLLGSFNTQGATLLAAYLFSLIAAITAAFVMRKSILRGQTPPFILEMPPYRWPHLRTVLTAMWERGKVFVSQAGTIILAMNVLLWFLASFPQQPGIAAQYAAQKSILQASGIPQEQLEPQLAMLDSAEAGDKLRASYAGHLGQLLEPVIRPLGFDWKIGIGLIGSFAAREVFVSTVATVYNLGDNGDGTVTLAEAMRKDVDPRTGKPVFSLLVALNLILFYILACQCMSTIAIVKRETGGWKWPMFMLGYMTALAYVTCLLFYQLGRWIGWA